MKYRQFGRTGLEFPELVFGCGAVGGLMINGSPEERQQAFDRAMAAGINWFDTAAAYGQGVSETHLGELLAATTGPRPNVSTKFTIDTRNPDIFGQVEASVTQSLERLQSDKVTLIQLHNPIGPATDKRQIGLAELLKPHGVLDAMDHLRAQGLADHIGITALGDVTAITRVLKSNRIDSAQVYYNLLNPSAGMSLPPAWPHYNFTGIVDTCHEHGVAPMNIRVFSAGVIATDARHGRERPLTAGDTVDSETAKATHLFSQLPDIGDSRAQSAVRFALANERLACVVLGLAELDHLEEAIAAQERGPLPETSLSALRDAWQSYTS